MLSINSGGPVSDGVGLWVRSSGAHPNRDHHNLPFTHDAGNGDLHSANLRRHRIAVPCGPGDRRRSQATGVADVDAGHRTEPTAGPIPDTPVVRATIAPAETETPQQTPTNAPTPASTAEPQAPPSAPDVIIECTFFDGLVQTTEADEYVQVLNQGPSAVDLLGWRLVDQSDGSPNSRSQRMTCSRRRQ